MLQALDLPIVRALAVPLEIRDTPPATARALAGLSYTQTIGGMVTSTTSTRDDTPADGRIGTLYGYSTVFGEWYEVNDYFEGNFLERIDPAAADQTIAEDGPDVKVMFNHGRDVSIGQKVLGVHEQIRADDTGVYYQVPMLDTSYNRDLLPGLRAKAYGSSFMFRVRADAWNQEPGPSDHNPKGIPERTITNYQLFEHGPVTFPANPAATAGARSIATTDEYYHSTLPAGTYAELAQHVRSIRMGHAPGGAEGAPGAEPAAFAHARTRALKLAGVIT